MGASHLHVELRAKVAGNKVAGHAAVFGQLADLGSGGWEALGRTAFDKALKNGADVRALVNHDPSQLLARSGNGSLRLDVDDEGLVFDFDLPDTTLGRDVKELVGNGLLSQMSFGFIPGTWERGEAPDGRQIRTHTSVEELRDVSLVAYPAYDGTSAELRSVTFPPGGALAPQARGPVAVRRATAKARLVLALNPRTNGDTR